MADSMFDLDVTDITKFFGRLGEAGNGAFKKEFEHFLREIGENFLATVETEIRNRDVIDTQRLLQSFDTDSPDLVWTFNDADSTLEVGTNVPYAAYVNDGHWTCKKGERSRWVPGVWVDGRFEYQADAKTGMALKQHWVTGKPYWEASLRIMERIMPQILENQLQKWFDEYFA